MTPSPTSKVVLDFAEWMEYQMTLKCHKGGRSKWLECHVNNMIYRLEEEVQAFAEKVRSNKDVHDVLFHAADVANITMIIADIYKERNKIAIH